GGKGDPRVLQRHVAALRVAYGHTDDTDTQRKIRDRIGKLLGGTAVLWVGGVSTVEISARKELAKRTLDALRATVGSGVVGGGGVAVLAWRARASRHAVALLACRAALQERAAAAGDLDERMA
ncbi:MAG TPA: hypothetical protein PKA05_16455, partial [Roseiflexaceae bacterium]|nr:hypothetical protein [Roseiflexaceae bacterium]